MSLESLGAPSFPLVFTLNPILTRSIYEPFFNGHPEIARAIAFAVVAAKNNKTFADHDWIEIKKMFIVKRQTYRRRVPAISKSTKINIGLTASVNGKKALPA